MDELLVSSQVSQPNTEQSAPSRSAAVKMFLRNRMHGATLLVQESIDQYYRHLPHVKRRMDTARVERPVRSALPFLGLSILIGALTILLNFYTICYSVEVDGVFLGYVQNQKTFQAVTAQVEGQAAQVLGQETPLPLHVSCHCSLASKTQVFTTAQFSTALYDTIPAVMQAYVLTVDGNYIGASVDKGVLDAALDGMKAQYAKDTTVSSFFPNEVRITRKYIPSTDTQMRQADLMQTLTQDTQRQGAHEVSYGETFSGIAATYNMTLQQIQELNPSVYPNCLQVGQIVNVFKTAPALSVCSVDSINYEQPVDCPVEQVPDSTMYIGEQRVLQQGTPGKAMVQAEVTSLNGAEQYRAVKTSDTLVAPTKTVIAVGTQERPKTAATGVFHWPTTGSVTSPFGYRYIFGSSSFHSGIDIANSYGTGIVAADGGTVTFAGYKGSYGNLVIIDHGNGSETYYAHCSRMFVSTGEKVYQGQSIANIGSTGRATGNHLHFEVHWGGTAVNPIKYLS